MEIASRKGKWSEKLSMFVASKLGLDRYGEKLLVTIEQVFESEYDLGKEFELDSYSINSVINN